MQPLTDEEERQKLCARLRRLDLERDVGVKAADEIERLAANQKDEYEPPLTEVEQLVNILRHAKPIYVGMNIRRQAADEIERLEKMVEFLAREVAGPNGIVADEIKAAEENICSR